jgi:hypothetical protein
MCTCPHHQSFNDGGNSQFPSVKTKRKTPFPAVDLINLFGTLRTRTISTPISGSLLQATRASHSLQLPTPDHVHVKPSCLYPSVFFAAFPANACLGVLVTGSALLYYCVARPCCHNTTTYIARVTQTPSSARLVSPINLPCVRTYSTLCLETTRQN